MKDFAGTPGTVSGLVLRICQCIFAVASITAMATSETFISVTAFCYLIASMGWQVIWSCTLTFLDAYALANNKLIHNQLTVSFFLIGDWVTAILSLAAASSSAGITILYFNDMGHCVLEDYCIKYQMSVVFAFFAWITTTISALIMLWLLAAG
ncbi:CASP-like protein 5B3 [Impatiens glandulifera]|uniref:CASP-like protein 5B3 n=1 Tax=Impatiens glandulifera TaxID=253017 RepID=UPI001FB06012|nr:CASP-like protein 5B3 [Impatiens glandulifera]